MDRCEDDWYASDNNFRGTPRGSRKKPNAGGLRTSRLSTAVLCRGLEKNGMVRAWHGRCMASVIQTRPHCVNQMGKTHSKPLAARHDRGTAWARHAMCESALMWPIVISLSGVCPGCCVVSVSGSNVSHGLRVRLHWSQNRHNTANQHLSGYTLQERVATFKPTTVLSIATTLESYAQCSRYLSGQTVG